MYCKNLFFKQASKCVKKVEKYWLPLPPLIPSRDPKYARAEMQASTVTAFVVNCLFTREETSFTQSWLHSNETSVASKTKNMVPQKIANSKRCFIFDLLVRFKYF